MRSFRCDAGMELDIIRVEEVERGKVYHLIAMDKESRILITRHAEERLIRWRLDVSNVIETPIYPEEVIVGHHDRYIAHRRYGTQLMRAVYEYEGDLPALVTVYSPSAERYFIGDGTYADKILP